MFIHELHVVLVHGKSWRSERRTARGFQSSNMSLYRNSAWFLKGVTEFTRFQRQQVVMTEQLAKTHTNIHFSVMHPGWVDTPAVANAMPDFHQSMKDSLRTPEQGADTVVWLSVSEAAVKNPSGRFYQDRKMVSTHLPLAWTHNKVPQVME
ncbi:DHRS-12_like_SDR_c-like domain-containing protein [Neolamprologus brichardi]|uniref:DHRS-12_like_SDR_c-like domain-containing protein n=1 Tax=Neolamprologus brichardi TaxID=32507 RepID=UPI0003EBCCF5|nr:DHRS-12_like_SDR_c-like domain-containing protein [Neolamprologus brichardi]